MLNSVISWVGGKRLLRKQIIPLIPKHDTFLVSRETFEEFKSGRPRTVFGLPKFLVDHVSLLVLLNMVPQWR